MQKWLINYHNSDGVTLKNAKSEQLNSYYSWYILQEHLPIRIEGHPFFREDLTYQQKAAQKKMGPERPEPIVINGLMVPLWMALYMGTVSGDISPL